VYVSFLFFIMPARTEQLPSFLYWLVLQWKIKFNHILGHRFSE